MNDTSHRHDPAPDSACADVAPRLATIRARIDAAASAAGRAAGSVELVAVSKFHPLGAVEAALQAGQRLFGENRVQEARSKFTPALREAWPQARLHIIGALQTNKALDAVRIADMIESLDRPALADAVARAADRAGRLPDLLLQINTGSEPQKAGALPEEADAFITLCRTRFGASVRGLMCIPPEGTDPMPHFTLLADMARAHGLPVVSMGMSGDFEQAIAAGATHVRVGSAIFGARPAADPAAPTPLRDESRPG
ncbi:hypothetical protein AA103196_1414 [Ameyamaea chiangmaiensis NBRC 103196]|nr:YggS family pyridoxal phosphate-dependent enzyme [Ameyamaea chiangmaiensis]MBS4075236.1 YggS family pyridoxal phosphate-dependent enzyme [Ameyamaea chiangmaiensis]GBQ66494.1 hypothetical protein AA103196_1414 [Ameyamaea chiangmaiensis NBRC 103196]